MNIKEIILFEDENILVVDKPAGIPVHKTLDEKRVVLENYLRAYLGGNYLGILHRLDKDTSGVMIFSKNRESNPYFAGLFEKHLIEKTYLAVTEKMVSPNEGRMEDFVKIVKNRQISLQEKVKSNGQKAILDYRLLQTSEKFHLYEIKLITGRMHQIRAQFKFRNCPLVGDVLYGDKKSERRLMLHCHQIKFFYLEKELIIQSKTPLEFQKLFAKV